MDMASDGALLYCHCYAYAMPMAIPIKTFGGDFVLEHMSLHREQAVPQIKMCGPIPMQLDEGCPTNEAHHPLVVRGGEPVSFL